MSKAKPLKGFYKNMKNEDYHNDDTHYSSTTLKKALKGSTYFYDYVVTKSKVEDMPQAALDLGNYLHIALLEPELLESQTEIFPMQTRGAKTFSSFVLENEGKTVITMGELQTAEEIINSFNTDSIDIGEDAPLMCSRIFKNGYAEESLFTELDGLPIKVRFDYAIYKEGRIVIRDLKTTSSQANTTQDADYICLRYGYYISAALYVDALRTYLSKLGYAPATIIDFELVFASKSDYNINMFRISEETLEKGRKQYKAAIALIKMWKEKGNYSEGLRKL